jgi:hypothetical protein
MAQKGPLIEIPEVGAPAATAHLYREIRRAMQVPFVALFYRNLAAIDGALEWMWGIVAPLLASGELEAAAAHMARSGVLRSPPLLPTAAPADQAAINQIIAAYNRANPMNFTCAAILGHVLAGKAAQSDQLAPEGSEGIAHLPDAPDQVPAMVSPEDFPPALSAAVARLETSDTAGDGIVPSLYRHLANWPSFLGDAVETLSPRFADGSLKNVAREISAAGQTQAAVLIAGRDLAPLPSALVERRQAVSESVEKFSRRIPEMIVVGRLLAAATNKENQQ